MLSASYVAPLLMPRLSCRRKRLTLCLSSQVGCDQGCTFCATGRMGLLRSLSAGEMCEQAVLALAEARSPVSRVVWMGMGEPLANYDPLLASVRWLTSSRAKGGLGLHASHVTVSTVGVIPRIARLAADLPGVRLALSLHAPTQALREMVVPSARAWRLPELLAAASAFEAAPGGSPPMMEYVLLAGENDGEEAARGLGELLQGRGWTLNLIPYNPGGATHHSAPSREAVEAFQRALRSGWGVNTTVRRTMGSEVGAACGQLATAVDIEDLAAAPRAGERGGGGAVSPVC